MTVPALTVSVQGQGSVGANQLNTYAQTCNTFADLRTFTGISGVEIEVRGGNSVADGLQGRFYWNATIANPVDDNTNTIVPNGAVLGAWSRLTLTYPPIVCSVSGTANAIVLTPGAGQPNISSYQNGQQFLFIAGATSTGSVTVAVQTNQGTSLPALNMYTLSSAAGGAGSVTIGGAYLLTYFSTLNSGAGGFIAGITTITNISGLLAAGFGITLSGSSVITIAQPTKAYSQSKPSNPTGPGSTGAQTMLGLAGSITPTVTGNVLVIFSGQIVSTTGSVGNGISYGIAYGTGTAPTNGAGITGTQPVKTLEYTNPAAATAADVNAPFTMQALLSGLTLNTAIWLDLYAEAVGATGFTFNNIVITSIEI